MPKHLHIPFLKGAIKEEETGILEILDRLPRQQILNLSWPKFKTSCQAEFAMCYTNGALLLKYYVTNDYFKSQDRPINGHVHFDNCVEFFVCFNNEPGYYNIEFNCLGIGKIAHGNFKSGRKFLSEEAVKRIKTWRRLDNSSDYFDWELTLLIPADVFQYSNIILNSDLICRGNFYKCGDHLPEPHFLSWNKIEADKPDFHSPGFFAEIMFSDQSISVSESDYNISKTFF